MKIDLKTGETLIPENKNHVRQFIDWTKFDEEVYNGKLEELLCGISICDNVGCIFDHRKQIDDCYEQIIRSISEASQDFLYDRKTKFTPVPGWNKYCKERYSEARVALIEWISEGKARFGDKFNRMKENRKIFVRSLNYCKNNRDRISNDIIVNKFRERKSKEFWKEVNSRKNNVRNKTTEVDGKKTNDDIVEVFYNKFSSITGARNEELGADRDNIFSPNRNLVKRLSTRSVKDAIASLSTGIGFDGVHSNHLKLSSSLIIFVYSKFFNSCLIHNHIPNSMLTGVINPIIKNKAGNVKDSPNFRKIMISSNFFKIF